MAEEVRVLYLRDSAALYCGGLNYATDGSAGLDLRACMEEDCIAIQPGDRACVPAGICVEACVPGAAGFIYSRSGLGAVRGLCVAQGVGVVDPDYRGEIMVWLLNTSGECRTVQRGERIAQLIFQPVLRLVPLTATQLSATDRGAGGFGHTGRQ